MDADLEALGLRPCRDTIVVVGIGSNNCVYHAVIGFHVRNYFVVVPEDCIQRIEDAGKRVDSDDKKALQDAYRAEGIKLCIEQIQEVREIEGVAGVHIMAIQWEAAIEPIVRGAGLYPRPIPEPIAPALTD